MAAGQAKIRIRTCIGCGVQSDKRALHRIVRTPEGKVLLDPTGRAAGRGAYVCSGECLETARQKRKLDRALKVKVDSEEARVIASDLEEALAGAEAR